MQTLKLLFLTLGFSSLIHDSAGIFRILRKIIPALLPDEDAYLLPDQIITKYGYPVEQHEVVTEDGYELTMYRIPYGKPDSNCSTSTVREPVLINHGILASAVHWLLLGSTGALPFLYADACFDVWLGNFRGTKFSLGHVTLGPNETRYWSFTADHMGRYDVPAQINYILEETSHSQLIYFGYSLSTNAVFMTLSEMPEYSQKIRRLVAVSPAVYIHNLRTPFVRILPVDSVILKFYEAFFNGAFITDQFLQPVGPTICNLLPKLCYFVFNLFWEKNPESISKRTLIRLSGHFPDITSAGTVVQILQLIRSGRFAKFDYGVLSNIQQYGSWEPPLYNLSKVQVPVCGLYAPGDKAVVPIDAKKTLNQLPNLCNRGRTAIRNNNWKHSDTIFGDEAPKLVYSRAIAFSSQHDDCSC